MIQQHIFWNAPMKRWPSSGNELVMCTGSWVEADSIATEHQSKSLQRYLWRLLYCSLKLFEPKWIRIHRLPGQPRDLAKSGAWCNLGRSLTTLTSCALQPGNRFVSRRACVRYHFDFKFEFTLMLLPNSLLCHFGFIFEFTLMFRSNSQGRGVLFDLELQTATWWLAHNTISIPRRALHPGRN